MMVGALNLISIAFAVLFVGLGVDFGIQFAVRYRSERYENGDLQAALVEHRRKDRRAADACGRRRSRRASCRSSRPTIKGVSELGQIAGIGMLIAYRHQHHRAARAADAAQAAGRARGGRLSRARAGRPVPRAPPHRGDRRHRPRRDRGPAAAVLPDFDFNPINLRSPEGRSRSRPSSTCAPIRRSARTSISVMLPNVNDDRQDRRRSCARFPRSTTSIGEGLRPGRPGAQARADPRAVAAVAAQPVRRKTARARRSDAQNVAALREHCRHAHAARRLRASGRGADAANRLARSLTRLAQAGKAQRDARRSGVRRAAADRARRAARAICRPSR